jgi:hypothetical protein
MVQKRHSTDSIHDRNYSKSERSAAMHVYGIKHDPMVHGMYRQNATTIPEEKKNKRKNDLEKDG